MILKRLPLILFVLRTTRFFRFLFFCLVRSPIPLTDRGEQKQTCLVLENPSYVVTRLRLVRYLLRFCYSFLFASQLQSWEIEGLLAPRLFLLVAAITIWNQRAHLEIVCSNCHVYLTISINKQRTSRVIS